MPPAGAGTTTTVDTPSTTNRRQPVRQTRTQPPKYAFSKGSISGRGSVGGLVEERAQVPSEPGFYPALTHFTDSISALPKEMLRHFGMFKEVDSKIYSPEEGLRGLVREILTTPQPPPYIEFPRASEGQSRAPSDIQSAAVSINGASGASMIQGPSQTSFMSQAVGLDHYDVYRRQNLFGLRFLVQDMIPVLEEKNHLISSATDELSKQLARCESSWSEIEKEFSEETRWGNLHHWAYSSRSSEKKDARVERPRREAAIHHNFASVQDDFGAVRGTGKRRAQQAQIENEIEETRANKRALGAGKAKKPSGNHATAVGLGLSTSANGPQSKKRKTEDATVASTSGMERSLSSVFGKGPKGNSSPRSRSPAAAKRARATATSTVNGKSRARAGTGASATNSPLVASSPVVGAFVTVKPSASPAISTGMQRQSSARARQNSAQGTGPPTSHPKQVSNSHTTQDSEATTPIVKGTTRKPKLEPSHEEPEPRMTAVKREDVPASRPRPPNISTGTRSAGKASKNATPVHSSFAEATGTSRPRSNRANHSGDQNNNKTANVGSDSPALGAPPKRSHKKGANSLAAIQQREELASRAAASSAGHGRQNGTNDGADDEDEGNGERYCYCGGPSYGDMIGCDGEGCPNEWYHLECLGMSKPPSSKGKWYCEECRKRLKVA